MDTFIALILGGLLIGGSAVLMQLVLGRITGISGIDWGAISGLVDSDWRWLFILGLLVGPLLYHWASGAPYPAASQHTTLVTSSGQLSETSCR